ncbi:hypothetical protein R5W24_003819 [Gemmata sp. JC717]|uniref:hypothetical protein n=1 Tax=Gemmata algarum TaxID=2975278 RepID=UPI0021BA9F50|nr:hypothetical protein [Gemmata algarum]MDY3554692.1 hypothetical protein [Gemmata algarum]
MKKKAAGGPKSWRAGSATEVRRAVVRFGASERKLRLHAVACCRLVGDQITHPDCVALVELIERRADADSLAAAQTKLRTAVGRWARQAPGGGANTWFARYAAWASADPHLRAPVPGFSYARRFRDVLAEVLGPRRGATPFAPEWRTATAVAIARQAYESRDFSALPILADALQDAGCNSADALSHCRDPNAAHVRGCWVVDLVLGKE